MSPKNLLTGAQTRTNRGEFLLGHWQPAQFLMLGILLGISLIFRAGLGYFFAQDDFGFLARLAQARTPFQVLDLILRNDHFYRPMARVVFLGIPYALFQTSPVGYHVFNLCLHLVNTLLVYRLLRALETTVLSATLGAGVYGFYPAHFTPLAWISGIQELSVTLMILVTCLAFIAWCRQPQRLRYYGLSLIGYATALLCKETAWLLPAWLALVQLRFQRSAVSLNRGWTRLASAQIGLVLVGLGYLVIRFAKANVTGASGPYTISLAPVSLWTNAQAYVLDLYGLHSISIVSAEVLTGLTALGLVALLVGLGSQRWRGVAGLVWCACFLAPTLVILDRHYSYYFSVAAVGVAIAVGAVADKFIQVDGDKQSPYRRRLAAAVVLLALLAWGGYSAMRVGEPFDEQSLKAKGERARQIMADFQRQYPQSIPCSTLIVTGAKAGQAELSDMFSFFYPMLSQVLFDSATPPLNATSSLPGVCSYLLPAELSVGDAYPTLVSLQLTPYRALDTDAFLRRP